MGIEDIIISLIPAEYLAWFAFGVIVASGALPVLQLIANKTANKWDNAAVARLEWLLAQLPRLRRGDVQRAQDAIIRASVKPPHFTDLMIVFVVLPLLGCAGTPSYDPVAARNAANAIRLELNSAHDTVQQAGALLPLVCAYVGPESEKCTALEGAYDALRAAFKSAYGAADLLDATGIATSDMSRAVSDVTVAAKTFGETVLGLAKEVADVLDQRSGGQGAGPGDAVGGGGLEDAGPSPQGGAAPGVAVSP